MEYNTAKNYITLREYGRNIQDLVAHLQDIGDKKVRSQQAVTLVEVMKQINPTSVLSQDSSQKVWDDLHIISHFELDIDSPYPTPEKDVLEKKSAILPYSTNNIVFKHFGKNIELLVAKATTLKDPEKRESAIIHIGRLMKTFAYSYDRDNIAIYKNIRKLSNNELEIDLEKVNSGNLFEPIRRERQYDRYDKRSKINLNSSPHKRSTSKYRK